MNRLKNYILNFEQIHIWIFHIKIKHVSGVTGDSRWPKDHPQITLKLPGHTYPPPKFCVLHSKCSITNQVNPKGMKQHNKILWNDVNENAFHWVKQCHNWMCTTFSIVKTANNDNNDKIMIIMDNNEK